MAGEIKTLQFADGVETEAPSGTTPLTNPMTTEGDIIIGGADGDVTRLPLGTDNQILRKSGNTVAWVDGLATADDPGLLSYYNEFSDTSTQPGAGETGTTTGIRIKAVRIGKQVTVEASFTTDTPSGNVISWTAILPEWARPSNPKTKLTTINGATGSTQDRRIQFEVQTNGTIIFRNLVIQDDANTIVAGNFGSSEAVSATETYIVD